ncbi:MAG TPA: NAD-dependent epimerase/dehydratase family protein [Bryobacteraceae bacterium]|jgi:UDP-sulfoquinovose synthase|nr:NAD-dependent epimerase/dehydratase family protein [Bryobacteraceae bacterium]
MKILILGGDGYLGWPTAMHLSARGHDVTVTDNFVKRNWELKLNVSPLFPIHTIQDRITAWREVSGLSIRFVQGDLRDPEHVTQIFRDWRPDAVVHYAEQPSAPYSMMDRERCVETQVNNVVGNLNVLWAIHQYKPDCHLVKLGTMGEYGTPNIDIEEGFIEIEHKGRKDTLPFPKMPGSFYHLSKVHDSHNIHFACRTWKLGATDLNQGVVYGIQTAETILDPRLVTSFHYDEVFGTAINRFCVEAVAGVPITVYGGGGQTRGFLCIRDTLRCVELALLNPAAEGEYRVFNQFTEKFTVLQLATLVMNQANALGLNAEIRHIENPRVEAEVHHYNPVARKLLSLGLEPRLLSDELIGSMLSAILTQKDRIRRETIFPHVKWSEDRIAGAVA